MAGLSNSRSKISALAAIVVLVLMTSTHFAAADYDQWELGGKEFTITNIAPFNPNPFCPGSDNTVTFYPSSENPLEGTAVVVGDFEGATIGVCSDGNYLAFPPGTYITYAIYGDLIIFQLPDRVPSASKIVFQEGKLYFITLNLYYVSELTCEGYAPGPSR